MIELRWMMREEELVMNHDSFKTYKHVPVLQYRQQQENPFGFPLGQPWTEWQDVPTVTEPAR